MWEQLHLLTGGGHSGVVDHGTCTDEKSESHAHNFCLTQRHISFSKIMVPSTESMQSNPLPSFLFQMLRDRDVNPHEVYLVPDNAAISPNPALRQAMSAPCLNRSPNGSLGSGCFGSNSQQGFFMSNARWSPNCVSPKSKGLTMKSSTAKALLMESLLEISETSSHSNEKSKKKKKSSKKSSTSSSSTSSTGGSKKVRPSHHDLLSHSYTPLHKSSTSGLVHKCSSTDSMLEFIKPRRRASPSPSERRNYRFPVNSAADTTM